MTSQLVNAIRAYLQSPDQTAEPRFAALAEQYSAACANVNDRLLRSVDAVQRGHRSQAVQLASCEPELLDEIERLSFPELGSWGEICAGYGWERADELRLDLALVVNQAYQMELKLAELMRRQRHLALAQAPIADRLEVIVKIAKTDPACDSWREDRLRFEKLRFQELDRMGREALEIGDEKTLADFLDNVQRPEWLQPLPPELEDLRRLALWHWLSKFELPETERQMECALSGGALSTLEELHDRWTSRVRQRQEHEENWRPESRTQELVQKVELALSYAKAERCNQEFQHVLHELDHVLAAAMSNEREDDRIPELVARLRSYGFAIPEVTQQRLEEYEQRRFDSRALHVGVVVSLGAASVAAVVLAFLMLA